LSAIAFVESLAVTLVGRGLFFYTHHDPHLGFTNEQNLGMALANASIYIVGAMLSHRAAARLSERRLVTLLIAGQILAYAAMFLAPTGTVVVAGYVLLGLCNGAKWPVIESYFTAGQTPAATAGAVGRFSLSWVAALPLALVAAGPMIDWDVRSMFLASMVLNVVSLVLLRAMEPRPVHLAEDHPGRPTEAGLVRCRALLASCRCSMLTNYALMAVLAALMPDVFQSLGLTVVAATALAAVLEGVRGTTFFMLHRYTGWHNQGGPLAAIIVGLPAGFALILLGPNVMALAGGAAAFGLASVIAGELFFGAAAGMTYYSSLYYSMVVKNASVEGGGAHESLIGLGSALGPATGAAGGLVSGLGKAGGVLIGVGPLVAACSAGAAWFLVKGRRGNVRDVDRV
jgi:predicted MFS family arabinose efflux permease